MRQLSTTTTTYVISCLYAALCQCACLADAAPPELTRPPAAVTAVVHAIDARGETVSLAELPRQPRFVLRLPVPLQPESEAPWLFTGPADPALLEDLERLPLTAANSARLLPIRRWVHTETVLVEPVAPLARSGVYTLALPRSAFMSQGSEVWTAALSVADTPEAGAAFLRSFPAAGARDVPAKLAFALVSYDGHVSGVESGLWLEDAHGLAVATHSEHVPCADYDSAAISCIRLSLAPDSQLSASSRYTLRSGSSLRDAHAAELSGLQVSFVTQAAEDTTAPQRWQMLACASDEQSLPAGCALVADDRVQVRLAPGLTTRVAMELAGQRVAQLPSASAETHVFGGLEPDTPYTLSITGIDAALVSATFTQPLRTSPVLATLSISEVYADAAGPEPAQEFIELSNFGTTTQALRGIHLSDSAQELGVPIETDLRLAAGARALLVSDGYDLSSASDPEPAAGTPLIRIGKTLTRAGLANAGETLFLRDAEGRRLSGAPASPAPRPGRCSVRVSADPRSIAVGSFEYAPEGQCTPGF